MTHPDQAIEGVDSFARAILNGERGKLPNGVTFTAVWRTGDSVEDALYSGVSRVALLVGNVDSKGLAGCGRTRADVAQPMARTLLPMAEKAAGQTIEQEIQAKGLTAARVTPADIENAIVSEEIFTAVHGLHGKYKNVGLHGDSPLHNVTICVLVLEDCSTASGVSHGLPAIEAATEARALAVASAVQRWNSRQ